MKVTGLFICKVNYHQNFVWLCIVIEDTDQKNKQLLGKVGYSIHRRGLIKGKANLVFHKL